MKERRASSALLLGTPEIKTRSGIVVQEARPGVPERLTLVESAIAQLNGTVERIENSLAPNGLNTDQPGDVIARTELQVAYQGKLLRKVAQALQIEEEPPDGTTP